MRVFKGNSDHDSDIPVECSARNSVKTKRKPMPVRRTRCIDPRFDHIYGGITNDSIVKENYAFLFSKCQEEYRQKLHETKILRSVKRKMLAEKEQVNEAKGEMSQLNPDKQTLECINISKIVEKYSKGKSTVLSDPNADELYASSNSNGNTNAHKKYNKRFKRKRSTPWDYNEDMKDEELSEDHSQKLHSKSHDILDHIPRINDSDNASDLNNKPREVKCTNVKFTSDDDEASLLKKNNTLNDINLKIRLNQQWIATYQQKVKNESRKKSKNKEKITAIVNKKPRGGN